MSAVHRLEPVDEPRLAEPARREPARHIGKAAATARTTAPIAASLARAALPEDASRYRCVDAGPEAIAWSSSERFADAPRANGSGEGCAKGRAEQGDAMFALPLIFRRF